MNLGLGSQRALCRVLLVASVAFVASVAIPGGTVPAAAGASCPGNAQAALTDSGKNRSAADEPVVPTQKPKPRGRKVQVA